MSAPTVEYMKEFKRYLENIRHSPRTIEHYLQVLSSFFGFHSGKTIEEITHNDIERFNSEHILKNHYSVIYQRQVLGTK